MGKHKDFDLGKVDKILARIPDEPGDEVHPASAKPALKPGQRPASPEPQRPKQVRAGAVIGSWVRVAAGLVLALAITQWPYGKTCGLGLFLYLTAIAAVLAAGVWAATHTWKAQLAIPHLLAGAVILWGLAIGLFQVLPRVGYARVAAAWSCTVGSEPVPAVTTPAAPSPSQPQSEVPVTDSIAPGDSLVRPESAEPDTSAGATGQPARSDSIPVTPPDTSR